VLAVDVEKVCAMFDEAASVISATKALAGELLKLSTSISTALKAGNKVLIFGNGGSAADAQHFAGELVGRFKLDRNPLPAIALTADSSVLTALANDFGFEEVFSMQVDALAKKGDVVIGITTSGKSLNVVKALRTAKLKGAFTAVLTGLGGRHLSDEVDICIAIPSQDTQRIQEAHTVVLHIVCELLEESIKRA
jgi:D-sedoheptulose 7-phosphate isomerase